MEAEVLAATGLLAEGVALTACNSCLVARRGQVTIQLLR